MYIISHALHHSLFESRLQQSFDFIKLIAAWPLTLDITYLFAWQLFGLSSRSWVMRR